MVYIFQNFPAFTCLEKYELFVFQIEAEECRDENPNCVWWAEEGECSRNPDYMLHNCKASCKQCRHSITDDTVIRKIEPEECGNKNPNCGWWAEAGECIKNPNYMLHICKASCKKCLQDFFPIECPVWAATDQCKISSWVVENCGVSCKQFSKDVQTNTKMIPSAGNFSIYPPCITF